MLGSFPAQRSDPRRSRCVQNRGAELEWESEANSTSMRLTLVMFCSGAESGLAYQHFNCNCINSPSLSCCRSILFILLPSSATLTPITLLAHSSELAFDTAARAPIHRARVHSVEAWFCDSTHARDSKEIPLAFMQRLSCLPNLDNQLQSRTHPLNTTPTR